MADRPTVAVIGGGPGGLMAAECLAVAGCSVDVYEHMASVGRKLLLAGRSGLNLTHAEPTARLVERYGEAAPLLRPAIESFDAEALRSWALGLGETTFVGSSGRVFPDSMRATGLLRNWLARLDSLGVRIHTRHRWTGMAGHGRSVVVEHDGESAVVPADAVVLALGGGSWPKVGSDGSWVEVLGRLGVVVEPLRPANAGFVVEWTDHFLERFEGEPLKNLGLVHGEESVRGEAVITSSGIEGGGVYALGAGLRGSIDRDGVAWLSIDLQPDLDVARIVDRLGRRRSGESTSSLLRRVLKLAPVSIGLMREVTANDLPTDPAGLAALVKAAPIRLVAVEPLDRAISTAGGVACSEVDERWMLRRLPGVFVVGEMIDWEAPTGGYLLQATFSSAVSAATGVVDWLAEVERSR